MAVPGRSELVERSRGRPSPVALFLTIALSRSAPVLVTTLAFILKPLPAQQVAGDSLLARGDTNGAIGAYEAVVKKNLKDAEAHYRAGTLYLARVVPGARISAERRKAEEHFRYAVRFEPDSAKYLLALAELLRTEGGVTTRVQIAGLVERARKAAQRGGGPHAAATEYRAARIAWEGYEQLANGYLLTLDQNTVDIEQLMANWNYAQTFFEQRARRDPSDPGADERGRAEDALRSTLAANPRHVDAAGLLAVSLGERDRWPEAYEVARDVIRSTPDSGRAHAIVGLVLARLGRWAEAEAAFTRALSRMTQGERAPYQNLSLILSRADSMRVDGMGAGERAGLDSLYWAANDPLLLSPSNETRVEFFARVTYVIHRWSDPLRGYEGHESDRGAVYVRYGPPDIWATLGRGKGSHGRPGEVEKVLMMKPGGRGGSVVEVVGSPVWDAVGRLDSERNTVVWLYVPSRLRFAFSLTPGFARAIFSGDHRALYEESRNLTPARFDNIPVVRNLDTIPVQVAQFQGDSVKTDVAVFATAPIGRMVSQASLANVQLITAAIVRDAKLADVVRRRTDETIRAGDTLQVDRRSWLLALRPDEYVLRLEAQVPALERSARSSSRLDVRSFAGDSLMLSDVVVAQRVTPRDSNPARWTDFFIDPSAGRFRPGEPIALLWEIYNLRPDSTGVARFRVDVLFTVKELERRGFLVRFPGVIGDAVGLSSKGDDKVNVSFVREAILLPGGRHVEHFLAELENAVEASYSVSVSVTDVRTGRVATAERSIAITRTVVKR